MQFMMTAVSTTLSLSGRPAACDTGRESIREREREGAEVTYLQNRMVIGLCGINGRGSSGETPA